jgi:hypothetical protein
MQYFFVTGSPKSGTTWLQKTLDGHSEVVCSGEGAFMERIANPIAKMREDYNSYQKLVAERVYGHRSYYDPIGISDVSPAIRSIIISLMSKRAYEGALAVGDKTPRHNFFLPGLNKLFPDAKFINIVRHPYDVAVSKLFHASRAGYEDALETGSASRAPMVEQAAKDWASAQQRVADFKQKHPGRMIEVKYEKLLEQPVEEATKLFKHLGVSLDQDIVKAAVDAASFENLSGGRSPGAEDPASFFRKGIAGDWKNQFEPAMTQLVDSHCLPIMKRYGYETGQAAGAK